MGLSIGPGLSLSGGFTLSHGDPVPYVWDGSKIFYTVGASSEYSVNNIWGSIVSFTGDVTYNGSDVSASPNVFTRSEPPLTSDYMSIALPSPVTLNFGEALTMELFIYIPSGTPSNVTLTQFGIYDYNGYPSHANNEYSVGIGGDRLGITGQAFGAYRDFVTNPGTIPQGQWVHIAVVWAFGGAVKIWINGTYNGSYAMNKFIFSDFLSVCLIRTGAQTIGATSYIDSMIFSRGATYSGTGSITPPTSFTTSSSTIFYTKFKPK